MWSPVNPCPVKTECRLMQKTYKSQTTCQPMKFQRKTEKCTSNSTLSNEQYEGCADSICTFLVSGIQYASFFLLSGQSAFHLLSCVICYLYIAQSAFCNCIQPEYTDPGGFHVVTILWQWQSKAIYSVIVYVTFKERLLLMSSYDALERESHLCSNSTFKLEYQEQQQYTSIYVF